MKIKLLDFTITADVSEEQEQAFKKELKEKYEVRESQLLDTIELLDYMIESIDYDKDSFVLSIYNVSTVNHNLPNSKIFYSFDIDIRNEGGISIESWRKENENRN